VLSLCVHPKKIIIFCPSSTVLDNEHFGNSELFPVTNMPIHLISSEQIGFSEQLCNDQKVLYYQV
jgi:hypothetical protein